MVIKMLGGKRASIRYQLRNPTARILRGDPTITQRLIDRSKFNQKYCGIVLSFEENITDATAAAILDDFRNLLCGGLEKDALDVLVVGHTDKVHPTTKAVRPDYHITAVETDLHTGKHVTIYHHRRDHDLFYAWERMTNIKYGLSRPDDPARRRTINIGKKLGQSRKDLLAEVDAAVCGEVKAGRVANRADVVRFLEEAGFTVPRQGENYLTIADKDGNRTRLRGLFYEREFTRQRLEAGQQQREQTARTNSEQQQTEWRNCLRAESQHFKNYIAEVESRCRKMMRLALAVTVLAISLASALMLAAIWRTARAESQLHQLRMKISENQDRLAKLRAAQFVPIGRPVETQGRTFIEIENPE